MEVQSESVSEVSEVVPLQVTLQKRKDGRVHGVRFVVLIFVVIFNLVIVIVGVVCVVCVVCVVVGVDLQFLVFVTVVIVLNTTHR
jgi:hypothetical protein